MNRRTSLPANFHVALLILLTAIYNTQVVSAYFAEDHTFSGNGMVPDSFITRSGVCMSGNGLVSGVGSANDYSRVGSISFYRRVNTISQWVDDGLRLTPSDNSGTPDFGISCSLNYDGDVAVIGGYGDNSASASVGAAWVFTYSGGSWAQQGSKNVGSGNTPAQKTTNRCGCTWQGYNVAIAAVTSDVFISGSYLDSTVGAAWAFTRDASSWAWAQYGGKMVPAGATSQAWAGKVVGVDAYGKTAAIGGYQDNNLVGSVWIFTNSGSGFVQQGPKFTASSPTNGFGGYVAFSYGGEMLVVGAQGDSNNYGCFFVFSRSSDGSYQQQGSKNVPSDVTNVGNPGPLVGSSVAVSADGKVILAAAHHDNGGGAVWAFTRSGSNAWTQYGAKMIPSNSGGAEVGDENGLSMSADGSSFLVGGSRANGDMGKAWTFTDGFFAQGECARPENNAVIVFTSTNCLPFIPNGMVCAPSCTAYLRPWLAGAIQCSGGALLNVLNYCAAYRQGQTNLLPSEGGEYAIAVSGNGLVACVGAGWSNGGVGSVWFFSRSISSGAWAQDGSKISPSDYSSDATFGQSVTLNFNGDVAAVGGPGDRSGMGSVWVFTRNNTNGWEQQGEKLFFPDPWQQGRSVAMASVSADVIVTSGGDASAVLTFRLNPSTGMWQGVDVLVPSNATTADTTLLGPRVAVSGDGSTVMLGGAVTAVFEWNAATSSYQSNTLLTFDQNETTGNSVGLSFDGDIATVGLPDDAQGVGAMLIYTRVGGGGWSSDGGKYIGDGYACGAECSQQGSSVSMSADGSIIVVSGMNDNDGVGAAWVFTRDYGGNGTWVQFGQKLVSDDYAIRPSMDAVSMSGDGATLFLSGRARSTSTTAPWIFTSSIPAPFQPCTRPSDTPSTIYSQTCPAQIASGTRCIPVCTANYAALPTWISRTCVNGVLSNETVGCYPVPTLTSVCPDKILANVSQTVVVQGLGFSPLYNISCILKSGSVSFTYPGTFIRPETVTCPALLWPDTTENQKIYLNVGYQGYAGFQQSLPITILGACSVAKTGSVPGEGGCVCPVGTLDTGSSCQKCANGEFQDEQGKAACEPCGNNLDTNGNLGSTSFDDCVCQPRYYPNPEFDPANPRSEKCLVCVLGMSCLGNNVVVIEPGFWRANNITASVLPCPDSVTSCPGTRANTTSLCASGYKGPLCNVCMRGYAKVGKSCVYCPKHGLNYFVLSLLILFALSMCYLLIRAASVVSDEASPTAATKRQWLSDVGVSTVFKVFLNYMQVLYYIGRLAANWSSGSVNFFSVIGQSTLSPTFIAVQCAVSWSFYTRLLLIFFAPAAVCIILFAIYFVRHFFLRQTWKKTFIDLQIAVMVILYQIHPTIMIEVISALPCQPVPGTGTSYLKADMHVNCNNPSYEIYFFASILYLVFYVLGLIVLVVYRGLYHNAKSGKIFQRGKVANQKYAFFFIGYTNENYYWEAVVLARKMVIAGLSVVAIPGIQLVYGGAVIALSYIVTNNRKPFRSHFINQLELLSLASLYIAVMIGFHSLLNENGAWSFIVLVLCNGTTALLLFGCCIVKLRSFIISASKTLPSRFRLQDDIARGDNASVSAALEALLPTGEFGEMQEI